MSDFEADARALLRLITERKIAVDHLQRTLDSEASRLAALPRLGLVRGHRRRR